MFHNQDLITNKHEHVQNVSGSFIEIEKKYLLSKKEVELLEQKCIEISLQQTSHAYEKNQNFDRENIFEKDDARLRLRTKILDLNGQEKNFEFTYKKRLSTEGGIKKESELNFNFTSTQSSENLLSIFKIMGFNEKDSYERIRKTFKNNEIQLTIDEFPFGYIAEIEGEEEMVLKYDNLLKMSNFLLYSLSCDDVYAELCRKKRIKPKNNILFEDKDMPKLEDYLKTWKR
ncbi:MAG: CYTH domain-containing protein [Patescibacteria group bacterium]